MEEEKQGGVAPYEEMIEGGMNTIQKQQAYLSAVEKCMICQRAIKQSDYDN